MRTGELFMLTEDTANDVIEALKLASMVNITWGPDTGMLCGNPFAERVQLVDVVCSNEEQAWMINRAKGALSQGDETAARAHVAPMIRKALSH
jgi:hypothetical protein